MNKLKIITYYEASDGKRFPQDEKERAQIYQDHLNAMEAVEAEYAAKIRKLEEEADRKFYGGR